MSNFIDDMVDLRIKRNDELGAEANRLRRIAEEHERAHAEAVEMTRTAEKLSVASPLAKLLQPYDLEDLKQWLEIQLNQKEQ